MQSQEYTIRVRSKKILTSFSVEYNALLEFINSSFGKEFDRVPEKLMLTNSQYNFLVKQISDEEVPVCKLKEDICFGEDASENTKILTENGLEKSEKTIFALVKDRYVLIPPQNQTIALEYWTLKDIEKKSPDAITENGILIRHLMEPSGEIELVPIPKGPAATESKSYKKRKIGIVKFYDSNKGFGYAVTNNYKINKPYELFELRINSTDISADNTKELREDTIITFNTDKSGRGISAVDVKAFDFGKEDFLCVFNYTGQYSHIIGTDIKGEKKYNWNVVNSLYNKLLQERGDNIVFIEALKEYYDYDSRDEESKKDAIAKLMSDEKTALLLLNIILEKDGVVFDKSLDENIIRESMARFFQSESLDWITLQKIYKKGLVKEEYYSTLVKHILKDIDLGENNSEEEEGTDLSIYQRFLQKRSIDAEKKNAKQRRESICAFLKDIGVANIKPIFESIKETPESISFATTIYELFGEETKSLFSNEKEYVDEIKIIEFLCNGDSLHLNNIREWGNVILWLEDSENSIISNFFTRYSCKHPPFRTVLNWICKVM